MSLAGRTDSRSSRRGVTLMEMLVVMMILSLVVGISYPSISSGLDSLRLNSAAGSVVSFLNAGLNHAERRQDAVEVAIAAGNSLLTAISASGAFQRRLDLPSGVRILEVLPPIPIMEEPERRFLLLPGGAVPRIGIVLADNSGHTRAVHVDPISGVPVLERQPE